MEKQTNEKTQKGFFSKISKRLTSLTMQKVVLAVAIIFVLAFIATAGNVIIKNGQITAADNLTVDTNTFVADATNNRVGIGTATPSSNLHIQGSGIVDGLRVETTSDNQVIMRVKKSGQEYYIGSDISNNGGDNFFIYDATDAATRLLIDTDGNAGIGTAAPTRKLSVNGVPHAYLSFNNDTERWVIGSEGAGYDRLMFFDSTAGAGYRMIIDKNGNVGIGTTAPTAKLHVKTSAQIGSASRTVGITDDGSYAVIYGWNGDTNNAHTPLSLRATSANQLFLNTDGNVGIGTATPSQKLHVQGNLNVTGDIWHNGVIIPNSPMMIGNSNDGQSLIGVKADDGKWVGCGAYATSNGYEWKCAPNAEVDAKLAKIEARRVCDSEGKLFNAETHECYDVPLEKGR